MRLSGVYDEIIDRRALFEVVHEYDYDNEHMGEGIEFFVVKRNGKQVSVSRRCQSDNVRVALMYDRNPVTKELLAPTDEEIIAAIEGLTS